MDDPPPYDFDHNPGPPIVGDAVQVILPPNVDYNPAVPEPAVPEPVSHLDRFPIALHFNQNPAVRKPEGKIARSQNSDFKPNDGLRGGRNRTWHSSLFGVFICAVLPCGVFSHGPACCFACFCFPCSVAKHSARLDGNKTTCCWYPGFCCPCEGAAKNRAQLMGRLKIRKFPSCCLYITGYCCGVCSETQVSYEMFKRSIKPKKDTYCVHEDYNEILVSVY
jgi:hypothetical protein